MTYSNYKNLSGLLILITVLTNCNSNNNDPKDPPALNVDMTEVDLGRTTSGTLKVQNTGEQTLNWSVSNADALTWLSLSATSGSVEGKQEVDITLTVDQSELSAGNNELTVTVTADPGGSKSVVVKAFLAVNPVLEALENSQISSIMRTTASVAGEVTSVGSSSITQHGHVWGTSTMPVLDAAGVSRTQRGALAGTGTFTSILSGLTPGTTYFVRSYATNGEGTGYSSEVTFRTLAPEGVNNTPTAIALSNASIAENNAVNVVIGTLSTTDADADDTHTYTLLSETSNFNINGNELRASASFDFESRNSYSIRIRTDDGKGGRFEQNFTIRVTDVVVVATAIRLSRSSIAENNALGDTIGILMSSPAESEGTYTLASGGDNTSFSISRDALKAAAVFDFETKTSFAIQVTTTNGAGSFTQAFTINITNVNEAPTDIRLSKDSVDENSPSGTGVGRFSSTDADAKDTHTYTLVSGFGDNTSFTIDEDSLKTAAVFDFEAQSSFSIRVQTRDAAGLTFQKTLTIRVTNAVEPFITTWQVTDADKSITIPTTGGGYNYTVDWGDGTVETGQTGNVTHTYTSAGDYKVEISGNFPRIFFSNTGDRKKDHQHQPVGRD